MSGAHQDSFTSMRLAHASQNVLLGIGQARPTECANRVRSFVRLAQLLNVISVKEIEYIPMGNYASPMRRVRKTSS